MKYGLLYYKDTDNIGDDIQTYAASQFLPKIDYMIDREKLNEFIPKRKEYVKTIMNAWYIHDKFNFGFSPYIYPLFISMFFKTFPPESGITVGSDYINIKAQEELKKYGPVGCRDKHTCKMMDSLDIDNYFSGCLTLTIKKFDNVPRGDYIVTVGLKKEEVDYIKSITNRKVIVFKQDVKKGIFKDEDWSTRQKRVVETLKLYQGAHMVITSKLHCSLPCLSLETPILLLYDTSFSENKDRIGTFLPYLNHINREDLFTTELNIEKPIKNPKKYLELRNNLIDLCENFVKKDIKDNISKLPDVNFYSEFIEKNSIEKEVIIKHLTILQNKYEKECEKSGQMYEELIDLRSRNKEMERQLSYIKRLLIFKIIKKIRNFKRRKTQK